MSQSLVEIKLNQNISWQDGDVSWRDATQAYWISASMFRSAMYDYADKRYWSGDVISYTPPAFETPGDHGGFARMTFGEIELSLDIFQGLQSAGLSIFTNTADVEWTDEETGTFITTDIVTGDSALWPPPREIYVTHKYTDDDEDGLKILMDGVGHLQGFDREGVRYDLYGQKYTDVLLETKTDYNGDDVPVPRAFGTVTYVVPLRLPDRGALLHPTYHKGYISGVIGTDWHVFDDGVDIDSNVIDNGDGTFSLNATPVGEVSVTGTGEIATLSDVIQWVCSAIGLSYTYNASLEANPSPELFCWATSQGVLIEFLDRVCAYFRHVCYISAATMICVDMSKDNGSRTLTEYDFFPANYTYPTPIAKIETEMHISEAVEESIGRYVKRTSEMITILSPYPYGENDTIETYEYGRTNIETSLEEILSYKLMPKVKLQVPMSATLPVPGEKLTYTDESSFASPLLVVLHCRGLIYDFINEIVEISGEGELG